MASTTAKVAKSSGRGSKPGERRGGRKAGTPNKTTQIAKDAIASAAEGLGGTQRLTDWAKEDPKNEAAFWTTIYPKLLPLQVNGAGEDGQHLHEVRWNIIGGGA